MALSILVAGDAVVSVPWGRRCGLACSLCLWRGQIAAAAVRPGLWPESPVRMIRRPALCIGRLLQIGGCSMWGELCGAGGLLAGLVLAAAPGACARAPRRFYWPAARFAALTGLLGCFMGGMMRAFWMALGEPGRDDPPVRRPAPQALSGFRTARQPSSPVTWLSCCNGHAGDSGTANEKPGRRHVTTPEQHPFGPSRIWSLLSSGGTRRGSASA